MRAPIPRRRRLGVPFHLLPTSRSQHVRCFSISAHRRMAPATEPHLTHIDSSGRPSMVNVGGKSSTHRSATATGRIYIPALAYKLIISTDASNEGPAEAKARRKGDVLTVAQLAGIMGAKRTSDLIPLCHPLALSHVSVELQPRVIRDEDGSADRHYVHISAAAKCDGPTGVEMEALTAVSITALTVWDMLKAVAGKEMLISNIMVAKKSGGKSGDFVRQDQ